MDTPPALPFLCAAQVHTGKIPEDGTPPDPKGLDPLAIAIAVLIGCALIIATLKRLTGIDLVTLVPTLGTQLNPQAGRESGQLWKS